MESIEGGTLPEAETRRWDYNRFIEYMLRVAREGKGELESIANFPQTIELSDSWHHVLDKMREETRDGIERWTPIGILKGKQGVFLPEDFLVGTKSETPKPSSDEVKKIISYGIGNIAGDIHSHTAKHDIKSFANRLKTYGRILTEFRGFSTTDLKAIIEQSTSTNSLHIMGLVDDKNNYFSFITKETEPIPLNSKLSDEEKFTYYWFEKFAPSIRDKFPPVKSSLWDINKGIAEEYKLALYRGRAGQDLFRSYPM